MSPEVKIFDKRGNLKEIKHLIPEIKVFDGQGNLKEIIQPEFNYECAPLRKYAPHECAYKKCQIITKRRFFCSTACAEKVKDGRKKARRKIRKAEKTGKPKRPCEICDKPTTRLKNCSTRCLDISRRARSMSGTKREEFLKEAKRSL
jgi:hypothetical protein